MLNLLKANNIKIMKPSLLLIIVIMCGVPRLNAQQKSPQSLKDIYLDAEYFFVNEEYEEALFSYNTILKRGYSNNANINYRVGQCYLNVPGSKHLATAFLEKAVKNVSVNISKALSEKPRLLWKHGFILEMHTE